MHVFILDCVDHDIHPFMPWQHAFFSRLGLGESLFDSQKVILQRVPE